MNPRDEQLEVTAQVAEIAATGLPLEPGLRALAEEAPSARTRRALLSVCRRLEAGEPLDRVVAAPESGMPLHVAGLLEAGLRTGRMPDLLARYLDHARRWQDLRGQIRAALIYPAVLLMAAVAVLGLYVVWLVPGVGDLFADFNADLPFVSELLLDASRFLRKHLVWTLPVLAMLIFGGPAVVIAVAGRPAWRRIIGLVPLFGPMLRYAALAECCHLLALLVRHAVPLPDVLRMAAAGTPDADVSAGIDRLAQLSESGVRLEDAPFGRLRLPLALRGAFRWEGDADALANSLEATGEVFASLAAVRAGLLRTIVGPIVIIGCAVTIAAVIVVLFEPLVGLLRAFG